MAATVMLHQVTASYTSRCQLRRKCRGLQTRRGTARAERSTTATTESRTSLHGWSSASRRRRRTQFQIPLFLSDPTNRAMREVVAIPTRNRTCSRITHIFPQENAACPTVHNKKTEDKEVPRVKMFSSGLSRRALLAAATRRAPKNASA